MPSRVEATVQPGGRPLLAGLDMRCKTICSRYYGCYDCYCYNHCCVLLLLLPRAPSGSLYGQSSSTGPRTLAGIAACRTRTAGRCGAILPGSTRSRPRSALIMLRVCPGS